VDRLDPLVFVPNQVVVKQGHMLTAVFFINKGRVHLLKEAEQDPAGGGGSEGRGSEEPERIAALSDHDNFGFKEFNKSERFARETALAITYCDVMSLGLPHLREALRNHSRVNSVAGVADATNSLLGQIVKKSRWAANLNRKTGPRKQSALGPAAAPDAAPSARLSAVPGGADPSEGAPAPRRVRITPRKATTLAAPATTPAAAPGALPMAGVCIGPVGQKLVHDLEPFSA